MTRWSPTRRVEQIAKPAEQASARPVFCFTTTRDGGAPMYATIRRYTAKEAGKTKDTFNSLKQRIEENFLPMLQDVQGFHCYYVMNSNDRELVTISIFENQTGARESTRRAAEFVRNDPLKDQLSAPELIEGELLLSKEAAVGAR
jgi:hypothetical protein